MAKNLNVGTFAAFTLMGAILGLATGFSIYKISGGFQTFLHWISTEGYLDAHPDDAAAWTIGGLIVGAAVGYLRGRNLG